MMMQKSIFKEEMATASYKPKNYEHLIGMEGFSEKLLTTHFKLYQGYVTNTNTLLEKIPSLSKEKALELSELRRRFGWEFNGMRLHEYYFDNLGNKGEKNPSGPIEEVFKSQFGGFDDWKKDFVAAGAMRGIGWVILYLDGHTGRFMNCWIEEHNVNHLAGAHPLLVMDVFEHAYMNDYGTDKEKYMEAFFKNINWTVVSDRYKNVSDTELVIV